MALDRRRAKGRADSGSFVAVPHRILEHDNYASLSARAVKLLIDLFAQYRGSNNGDLAAAWKLMQKRGWRSKETLHRAKRELLQKGFIETTRQGGRHVCSLFAVTWLAIDECGGKLDVMPTRVASGHWKLGHNPDQ